MNALKFCELVPIVFLLFDAISVGETDPITNREAVERKFLKQRKKLRVARKLNPIGGKMSKHYVETDPVCGMNTRDRIHTCVLVAERFFDNRRLAFGLPGKYKKPVMGHYAENCLKGLVLLDNYPKKAVRVNMYRCPTSNYIFEQGFQMKDFYMTSSSSLKKVYILRDLYDTSPLHVGEFKEELLWGPDGWLAKKSDLRKSGYILTLPIQEDASSSSEMDDTEEPLNPIENITDVRTITPSDDGVYSADDGRVIGRLYALVDGVKLYRMYMHKEPQKKDPNKIGFWRRLWNNFLEKFPRIGKSESDERKFATS